MGDTDQDQRAELLQEVVEQNKNSSVITRMRQLCNSIVVNLAGYPIQSDLDIKVSTFISKQALLLKDSARSAVRDIDPDDELTFLRVKTKKNEMVIAHDEEFSIITIRKE